MSKDLSPQRRKVVVLAASVACFSAVIPIVMRGHHRLGLALLCVELVLLIFVMVQFVKVMKEGR